MAAIDGTPRPAYIWDKANSKWVEISGRANLGAAYDWTNNHTFAAAVTFKNKVNYFTDAASRTTALGTPPTGTTSFLVNDASGVAVNRLEYFDGANWVPAISSAVETRTATAHTLLATDYFKVLQFTNAAATTFTLAPNSAVPMKVGASITINRASNVPMTIAPGSGVTIQLASGTSYTLGRYGSAILIKVATDSWIMIGIGSGMPAGGTAGQALTKVDSVDYSSQWTNIVPAAGGTFTGPVSVAEAGGLKFGSRQVFVSATTPTGAVSGDIWIQVP